LAAAVRHRSHELDTSAHGVYVIAPTPFHADGRIDDASKGHMTDWKTPRASC
jgi:4-hydroxy-tetrahydrodipicolinate synthase